MSELCPKEHSCKCYKQDLANVQEALDDNRGVDFVWVGDWLLSEVQDVEVVDLEDSEDDEDAQKDHEWEQEYCQPNAQLDEEHPHNLVRLFEGRSPATSVAEDSIPYEVLCEYFAVGEDFESYLC